MKTVEIVVVLTLFLNFALTSSINLGYKEAVVEDPAETGISLTAPGDEETLILVTSDLGVVMWEARRCLPGECNAHCRKLGFATGVCIRNLCQCRLRTSPFTELKEDVEEDFEPRAQRGTASACAQICRRLGFRYSRCSGSRCICWR